MKTKSFRLLWVGQCLANSGDLFYIIGLISILYKTTGSAFFMALLPFLTTIARFISGLIAPIFIEKFSLRVILYYSQGAKTILLVMLSLNTIMVFSNPMLWLLFILVFVISFLDGWAIPARNAFLPRLVKPEELVKANSFISMMDQTIQFGGWAFGGLLVALWGGQNILWLTVILFIISTWLMKLMDDQPVLQGNKHLSPWGLMKEGWLFIWKNKSIRTLHVMISFESIAYTVWIAAIIYIYVNEQLHKDEIWWGYINASFLLGLIAAAAIGFRYASFIEKRLWFLIITCSIGVTLTTFIFGLTTIPLVALIISFLFGIFEQIKGIATQSTLQMVSTETQLPKIYAAQSSLTSILFGLSSLLFGLLVDIASSKAVFVLSGAILMISTLYLWKQKKFLVIHRFNN